MSDIKGLFDLSGFEEAGENDVLKLSLNGQSEEFTEAQAAMDKVYDLAKENYKLHAKMAAIKNNRDKFNGEKTKGKIDEICKNYRKQMEENSDKARKLVMAGKDNPELADEITSYMDGGASPKHIKESLGKIAKGRYGNAIANKNKAATDKKQKPGLVKSINDIDSVIKEYTEEEILDFFESATFDGMIEDIIRESTEIEDKCPSCNPEVEFDPSTKTNQEIPVPGGDKEQPSTSVKEQEIAVPGGDKEQPSSKPAGQSVPAANKVLLDSDTYNAALDQLQKSFKEAVDVINMIQNVDVVQMSVESKQEAYAEAAMDEAYYNALIDGPMFEYVSRGDKDEVKAITKKISKEVKSFCAEHDYDFYQPKHFSRMVVSSVDSNIPTVRVKTFRKLFSNKMWQVIGVVYMDDSDEKKVQKMLNDKYKEDLGEYKIILQSCGYGGIIEWFNAIFKKKNRDRLPYVLYVDRTFDKELEKAIKDAAKDKEN